MNVDEEQELIEIDKLHAGLTDGVSRQRGTINRFYLLDYLCSFRHSCSCYNNSTRSIYRRHRKSDVQESITKSKIAAIGSAPRIHPKKKM